MRARSATTGPGGPGWTCRQLPQPMRREVAWCVFRIIELGGKIPTPGLSMLVRRLGEVLADRAGQAPASLLGLSGRDWCQQIQHAVHRRTGRLPAPTTMNNIRGLLTRMTRLLVTALDTGPWWHRDQWNPVEDTRIPLRDHEPMGRYSVRFDRIGTLWLRRGLQWHCKVGLDTGVLSWSTVHRRIVAVKEFDAFLRGRPGWRAAPCRSRRRGARPHAGLPRPPPRQGGHPWTPCRPAAVAGLGAASGQRCRAVLPVHGRQQGHGGRRAGRTGLATARGRARWLLPAR